MVTVSEVRLEAIMHFRGFSAALGAIVFPTLGQRNQTLREKGCRARRDRRNAELRDRFRATEVLES
jgi:hypothetical protein